MRFGSHFIRKRFISNVVVVFLKFTLMMKITKLLSSYDILIARKIAHISDFHVIYIYLSA